MAWLLMVLFAVLAGWLWQRLHTVRNQRSHDQNGTHRDDWLALAEERLGSLTDKAMHENVDAVLHAVEARLVRQRNDVDERVAGREERIASMLDPVQSALSRVDTAVRELDRDRKRSDGAIGEHLRHVVAAQEHLQGETRRLSTALRTPHVRGRWGEMQLRRVVEIAGMSEHCDFVEQGVTRTEDRAIRPDLVVTLPDNNRIVVDAKVPLQGLLDALEAADEQQRVACMRAHAAQVRQHVSTLAGKAYWESVAGSPEFVVLFMPGESFLANALQADNALMEYALGRRVILATPTTLMALLNTVAYGWKQQQTTEAAREIADLGRELHSRLSTFTSHLSTVGKRLDGATDAYNHAVSSLERRVLVTARKLEQHGAADIDKELGTVPPLTGRAHQPAGADPTQSRQAA